MLYEISDELIIKFALENKFKLKEQPDGTMALNPYVFEFVRAILNYLHEQSDNYCSCGHDWSAPRKSTLISEGEVPVYMTKLGEWDTSNITNLDTMFAPMPDAQITVNVTDEEGLPLQGLDFVNNWTTLLNANVKELTIVQTPPPRIVYYPATLQACEDGPGYVVTFRDIPEAITQGSTLAEAIEYAEDALDVCKDFYEDRPYPSPSAPQQGDLMIGVKL